MGTCTVTPPSTPGTIRFLRRMLAKVPRTMTLSLPRRAPKELKSRFSTPFDLRYAPAGPFSVMSPAGEMWSVVIESPSTARTCAPTRSWTGLGSRVRPWKKGGSWM